MTAPLPRPPVALTIAGSDPSGGAGIQADLKTFSALGAFGTSVITALTAQSTTGVTDVHEVPVAHVRAQLETLVADVRIDVVKVGMLASAPLVEVVHELLTTGPLAATPVVLDPVMVSTSGSRLLAPDAVDAVRALLPRADVVTPNVPEAGVLLDEPPAAAAADLPEQARRLRELGARRVLLKGGHLDGPESVDLWLDDDGPVALRGPRVATTATHGTGCTLSSAIAALRPRHDGWRPAVREARGWLTEALRHGESLEIGAGAGPVHHFHELVRWRATT
ncbi:phosphomethylpyrimidine kinase [Janibacter hoylei PVAS-1]|uniref:Phosphomethylpyrimidine kinase n=1 Tax=Janibacter hoylei PVAS-1 TaxID=1210046 RepID=K1EUN5_9MICO|nr:bifunctional hydroxymethylpyrimidine kinase/phosphomethylpyrimidine kinase [Janibacter hoylei]EKA62838.1 phosphomethylpyrimidine kinase [Janibacter hoylei PVAS-1]RWU82110.1 bifunctional hydroxymethylpyrimidine kinase/phosphomethylpyrimidine kinase [Janibacter hoylei PVAS-1]